MPYHGFFTPLRRLVVEKVTAFQEQCDFFTAPWTKQLALVATNRAASMSDLEQPAIPSVQQDYSYSGDIERPFFSDSGSHASVKQENSDSLPETQSASKLDATHSSVSTQSQKDRAACTVLNSIEPAIMHQSSIFTDKSCSSQAASEVKPQSTSEIIASESALTQETSSTAVDSTSTDAPLSGDKLLQLSSTHGVAYAFRNIRIDHAKSPTDTVNQQEQRNSTLGLRLPRSVRSNQNKRPHVRFDIRARRRTTQNANANTLNSTASIVDAASTASAVVSRADRASAARSETSTQGIPSSATQTLSERSSIVQTNVSTVHGNTARTNEALVDMVHTNAKNEKRPPASDKQTLQDSCASLDSTVSKSSQINSTNQGKKASLTTPSVKATYSAAQQARKTSIEANVAQSTESSVASPSKQDVNLNLAANTTSAYNNDTVKSERRSEANLYSKLLREAQKQDNVLTPALSAEDLAQIEALRKKYADGMMDFENGESISELSSQMGLGRLGEDEPNNSDNFAAHDTPHDSKSYSTFTAGLNRVDQNATRLGTPYNDRSDSASTNASSAGTSAVFLGDLPLRKGEPSSVEDSHIGKDKVSPRVLAASASLLPDTKNELLASVVQPDQFSADSASLMRIENINLRHQDVMRNELQFKAGFSMQGHLPGSILYVHNEHKVYIDPVAASQLGFDVKKAADNNPSKELYPSRRRFPRPIGGKEIQESKTSYESKETNLTYEARATQENNRTLIPSSKTTVLNSAPSALVADDSQQNTGYTNRCDLDRNAEHHRIDQDIHNTLVSKQQTSSANSSISSTTAVSFAQQDQSWLTNNSAGPHIADCQTTLASCDLESPASQCSIGLYAESAKSTKENFVQAHADSSILKSIPVKNTTDLAPNAASNAASHEEALCQNELVKAVISSAGFALDTSDTNQVHKLNKVALAEHAKAAIKDNLEGQQQNADFTVSGKSIKVTPAFSAEVNLMTAAAEVAHTTPLAITDAMLSTNTLSNDLSDKLSTKVDDKDAISTLSYGMYDALQDKVNATSVSKSHKATSNPSNVGLGADLSNLNGEKQLDEPQYKQQNKSQSKLQELSQNKQQENMQESMLSQIPSVFSVEAATNSMALIEDTKALTEDTRTFKGSALSLEQPTSIRAEKLSAVSEEKLIELPSTKLNEATKRGINIWQYRGLGSNSEAQLERLRDPQMSSLGRKSSQNMGVPSLKFLHLLGREITGKLFFYLRLLHKAPSCLNPLHCRIEACPFGRRAAQREARHCPYVNVEQTQGNTQVNRATDSISFEVKLNKPNGTQYYLYIRATAFYEPKGKLLALSFSLSQQASRYFALVPNVVADNSSFDWHVPSQRRVFSPNFYRVLGYPVNSPDVPTFMPDWIRTMIHPDEQNKVLDFIHNIDALRHNDCYELYYRLKRADGNYFWTKITGVVFARDAEGRALRVIGSLSNINHVVDSYEKIRNKIYTDVLTGLKNRAYMHSQLPFLLHPLQQPLGIIFVDATALKLYNDYLSHTTGDRLLITLTALLNHTIPSPKDLVRLSGDEFVCLIPNCSSERLKKIESAIIESRTQYNNKAPVRMPVFFSFGSSVLDLRDSLYANRPELLQLKADEPLPSGIMPDAKELFYLAVQASDLQMQFYKRHNKQMHYELIKAYIENILQYSISLNDSRISMTINK